MHVYDGTFPLDLLAGDEAVESAGDRTGACVVTSSQGATRIEPGDLLYRDDGRLVVVPGPRDPGGHGQRRSR